MTAPTLVWFRQDLRLADNPALASAAAAGPVIPLYAWGPDEEDGWAPGGASSWWLHHSLAALDHDLRRLGSRLVIRRGPALETLVALLRETGATRVVWNRRYEPAAVERDAEVKAVLRDRGVEAENFNASLLFEPWDVRTKSGGPYQVFTPFWRACLAAPAPPDPLPAPRSLPAPARWPEGLPLDALELLPRLDWAGGLAASWTPGERGARQVLARWLDGRIASYAEGRDRPDHEDATSELSPHLHFGELSPRQAWAEASAVERDGAASPWLRQLVWREFAHHLLFHFPRTPLEPLRPEFARFPWEPDAAARRAWERGRTGYPLVDAGLRQLWQTGWMHNRVRMVVASFLVKDLLVPWQDGARWFWDTLVDADLANNTLGWQWTAGCGADAAPYFRIFNPVMQGKKFDPDGTYVRRFVPELADLPAKWIHEPWTAPPLALKEAGIELGRTYPRPIVDHAIARDRALAALSRMGASR